MQYFITLLVLSTFIGYLVTNKRPFKYSLETKYDKLLPLIPIFVFPYILLYPLIVFSICSLFGSKYYNDYLTAVCAANLLATGFWYFYPNGLKRNKLDGRSFSSKILNFIYLHDGDTNGFPSGHVFLSIISGYYLFLHNIQFQIVIATVCFLIAISTVLVKQHYLLDILGGILFGLIAIFISRLF